MKRIKSIKFKHEIDPMPDTSWLGEFSDEAKEGAIKADAAYDRGGSLGWKYFNPANPEYGKDDYKRMQEYLREHFYFMGISAEAEIQVSTDDGKTWLRNTITSGGLWGIESDSDESYLREVEQEQLAELTDQLIELGFAPAEIKAVTPELVEV